MNSNSTPFATHVAQLLRDPLHCVREAAREGQRVIGYVDNDIPVELILAANALPIGLTGVAAPTPHADAYLESSFHPELRGIAECWLAGDFSLLDAVIFPRSNDSAQRLYYYLCELQRAQLCKGPTPLLFDTATISRDTSLQHTLQSTRQLASDLGTSVGELSAALERTNRRQKLLEQFARQREAVQSLPGSESYRVARAAKCDWSEAFDQGFQNWLTSQSSHSYSQRILFAGNAPPDERMHVAVEAGNGVVVRECTAACASATNSSMDPLTAIAERHYSMRSPARLMLQSPDYLSAVARDVAADAVILWAIEEDEALPWEIAKQATALQAAKIPVLLLTRQRWLADDAILQAVTEFVRGLERKR